MALLVSMVVLLSSARTAATPHAVVKRLRRRPGPFTVTILLGGSTWDPSRSPVQGQMRWGRATATYSLDERDVVHLHYEPQSGAAEDLEGPIPPTLEKAHNVMRVILAVYLVVIIGGFTIAYLVAPGSPDERFLWGVGGVLAAMMVVWVCALMANVIKAIHDFRHQRQTPASW
jgi:hypothetical protein